MDGEFKTKDLGEASGLVASGVEFIGLKPSDHFYWFVFKKETGERASKAYWSNELMVDAKTFWSTMQSLKDRLFSQGKP
jgi:hypothetical protein